MSKLLDWDVMSGAERQAAKLISEHSPLSFMRVFPAEPGHEDALQLAPSLHGPHSFEGAVW